MNKISDKHSKIQTRTADLKDTNKTGRDRAYRPEMHRGKPSRHGGKSDDTLNYKSGKNATDSGKSETSTYPGNDISWYQRVPNLLETAKQVAFNLPLGVKLNSTHKAVPGIIALDYIPIIGYCEPDATNSKRYNSETEFYDVWAATPVNIAIRQSYSKVRSSKGGSRPYDYPDMAQMLISAATIYTYIIHLQRVLRCVNRFNFQNKYLGESMVAAQGFKYEDLVKNYTVYVGRLNLLVEKARTVAIPADLAVMSEWFWRNSNIFKDTKTDNIKQQYTIDVPNGYYEYNEAEGTAPLHPVLVKSDSFLSMPTVLTDLESAVSKLWNSETFAILMGDIRFAYQDRMVNIPQMSMNEIVEPVFNLEHAIGVQNMNFLHSILMHDNIVDYTTGDAVHGLLEEHLVEALTIHQDLRSPELNNGAIFAGPAFNLQYEDTKLRGIKIFMGNITEASAIPVSELLSAHKAAGFCDWTYLNMYSDIPDGETLIYATRMKMVGSLVNSYGETVFGESDISMYYQIVSSTACLWLGPRIILEPTETPGNERPNGQRVFNIYSNTYNISLNTTLLYGLSQFNIAPKAILYELRYNNPNLCYCYILGDIEVGSDMANSSLAVLQSVCLYSQWLIPDTVQVSGFTPRVLTK